MWAKTQETARFTFEILRAAGNQYGLDRVNRMAAAVAYRTMFALAPLLLLAIFFLGLVVGDGEARQELLDTVARVAGDTAGDALDSFLDSVGDTAGGAGLVGLGLLLWTGSSLFLELQGDLNDIFDVPAERTTGLKGSAIKRGIGFLWSLGLGMILVAIWLLNSFWRFLGDFLPAAFAPIHVVISYLAPVVSVLILPFVFALVFQTLTRVRVRWRAVWWGSFFTSVVFLAATYGAGLYFSIAGRNAATAVGAIFIILLLAFILSAVFLFGAEVTKVYDSHLDGRPLRSVEEHLPTHAVVDRPDTAMPLAAIIAFLGGLFVGWRRRL
jgi:membrane protein